jgi:ribosomal protein S18 acetylase RimI-like enzyme
LTTISPRIRNFAAGDAAPVMRLFHDTVHAINSRDYSPEQIAAWAPDDMDETGWREFLLSKPTYIADLDGEIVGFGQLESTGYIDCFYCHHRHQRQGIGALLMDHIERIARQARTARLSAAVSITARPFFERHGFRVVSEQTVAPDGMPMRNFIMEKMLQGEIQNL